MKYFIYIILSILLTINQSSAKKVKVGIIEPIEHQAINIITNSFISELKKLYPEHRFDFTVKNAQADANLLRSISKMYIQNNYDLLIPIGTQASQMLISLNHQKIPMIALAAKPENITCKNCNVIVINDEIGPKHVIELSQAISNDPNITIIYSNNEKSVEEAAEALEIAKKRNIKLRKIMVNSIQELYTISKLLRDKSILIFKDNIIASNIAVIVKQLKNAQILITSDEGSINKGACIGVGVIESEIGKAGARNFSLDNKFEQPKVVTLDEIVIFYNQKHCKSQNFNVNKVNEAARQLNYKVMEVK